MFLNKLYKHKIVITQNKKDKRTVYWLRISKSFNELNNIIMVKGNCPACGEAKSESICPSCNLYLT